MNLKSRNGKTIAFGAATSFGYMGCILFYMRQFGDSPRFPEWVNVMSISFLMLAPFGTGALVNWSAPKEERGRFMNLVGYPCFHSLAAFSIALIAKLEGVICLLMAIPAFLILSTLGAVFFHLVTRKMGPRNEKRSMVALLLLPVFASPIEGGFKASPMYTTTLSHIEIAAPRATVWKNIIRVPRIAKSEIPLSLSVLMGFPDPVEATLSHEGVGGVRRASFKGNVLFTETIDAWEDGRKVSFSIVPNTAEIPPTTMDEHMIVGGKYFNVLRGTYEIEDLGNGRCLLKLSSNHVATTDFNLYAGLWGRVLMGDIQDRILKVIKARCERGFIPAGEENPGPEGVAGSVKIPAPIGRSKS